MNGCLNVARESSRIISEAKSMHRQCRQFPLLNNEALLHAYKEFCSGDCRAPSGRGESFASPFLAIKNDHHMTPEELEMLRDLEEEAIEALSECFGYECVEYDNGTYECDNCPFYRRYCELEKKVDQMLNDKR